MNNLPGEYGGRAWTRLEALTYFAISALGAPGTREIHAVAAQLVGGGGGAGSSSLSGGHHQQQQQGPRAPQRPWIRAYRYHFAEGFRPSAGVLFSEGDRPVISQHEEEVLRFLEDGLGSPQMLLSFIRRDMLQGRRLGDAGASSLAQLLRMERAAPGGACAGEEEEEEVPRCGGSSGGTRRRQVGYH